MDEKQLLGYYTSGGDLGTLSESDLRSLGMLMGYAPPPPENITPPPGLGFTPPGQEPIEPEPSSASIGDTPPQEFVQWLISSLLKGGMVGAGLGMPHLGARTLIETILGGAEGAVNPPEGQSRLESAGKGAALQGGMEGIAGMGARALPRLGAQAGVRSGTSASMRPGNRTREYVEAFLNSRKREGFGRGVPVGKKQGSVAKNVLRDKPIREKYNTQLDEAKAALPKREINFDEIRSSAPSKLRQPEKFVGLDAPVNSMENIAASDAAFWDQNKQLIDFIHPPGGTEGPVGFQGLFPGETAGPALAGRTLPGRAVTRDPTKVTFGETIEMAQRQGKSAQPVFERTAKGDWVRASDTPGQQAARERRDLLKGSAEKYARSKGPEGNKVADSYLEANAALSDQYKIEEIADKLRRGFMAASVRGGLGAGTMSGMASLTGGDYRTAGATGGILGVLGYPANLSRVGNMGGRVSGVIPSAVRLDDIVDQLFGPESPIAIPKTRLRKPKK